MYIPLINVSAAMCIDAFLRYHSIIDDVDWAGGYGVMPADPDNYIHSRDTGGRNQAVIQRSGEMVLKHAVQVRVRCLTYYGITKCNQIQHALVKGIRLLTLTVPDSRDVPFEVLMTSFQVTSPTTFLGLNENNRTQDFSLNGFLSAKEIH